LTEDDDYAKCAGDGLRKCAIEFANVFSEHQVGLLSEDMKNIRCIEEQANNCTEPIMQHFKSLLEAYKKHLKELLRLKEK